MGVLISWNLPNDRAILIRFDMIWSIFFFQLNKKIVSINTNI